MHRLFTTEKTVQNREFLVMHTLYIKPLTLLAFVALLVHFQTLFLMFFLDLLEITFPTRGHTTIFKKIDYMAISHAGLWGSGGPWQIKK